MNNVKVRITIGNTTVEIEAPPEKLEEAVKQVVSAIKATQPQEESRVLTERRVAKNVTCRGIVEELLQEGWFNTPRSLAEVSSEMARRGYNYDRTAIAHVLLDMVRMGLLVREGEARNYVYSVPRKMRAEQLGERLETRDEA
ncbi:MAG TPA: hypothetical protein EYH45_04910 [Candidatus Caldiarchaeum subterraneum]|uniref:Uncharacterized protein n=1 Tax=Caldiarchaeum subterraneum TaxID=311458 RepID=A0A832ZWR4_CALS0|nr:hypothetical protein [Candidatus Caldarchaeum subterraneum]